MSYCYYYQCFLPIYSDFVTQVAFSANLLLPLVLKQILMIVGLSVCDVCTQEAAINVFSTIKKYINDQTIRKLVLPKAKSLFTKSTSVRVGSVVFFRLILSKSGIISPLEWHVLRFKLTYFKMPPHALSLACSARTTSLRYCSSFIGSRSANESSSSTPCWFSNRCTVCCRHISRMTVSC